jgi:tRNA (uracil-5-)-methyltransferase TRM9
MAADPCRQDERNRGSPCGAVVWHAGAVDRATRLALNTLNRDFYAREAQAFRAARREPWPGFARVLARLRAAASVPGASRPQAVLDVGSGDGRFAQYLSDALGSELDYTGVDASLELTAHARARGLGAAFRFEARDFVEADPDAALPDGPFVLIALFGVLHHVPGQNARRELLRALARRLLPGGLLAFTFWRLDGDARFDSRVIDWSEHNGRASTPIALAQLERGDTLLRFGQAEAPRYCHFCDPVETEELVGCTELTLLDRFRADGRGNQLNEYVVLSARAPM